MKKSSSDVSAHMAPLALVEPPTETASAWERLRNWSLWKEKLYDVTVWFLFGIIVTQMLSMYGPGRIILVGTDSITKGVYWLDTQASSYQRGDYASFWFKPEQQWLKDRYDHERRVHTKRVVAIAGDTIKVDSDWQISLCSPDAATGAQACIQRGAVLREDSKLRPMTSWVTPGAEYTLRYGEAWVMGDHPNSLDSRYQGPIQTRELLGRATLLLPWG